MLSIGYLIERIGLKPEFIMAILDVEGIDASEPESFTITPKILSTIKDYVEKSEDLPDKEDVLDGINNMLLWLELEKPKGKYGLVTYFNEERGFGLIESVEEDKIFVHISNVKNKTLLRPGQLVSIEIVRENTEKNRLEANKVSPFDKSHSSKIDLLRYSLSSRKSILIKPTLDLVSKDYFKEYIIRLFALMQTEEVRYYHFFKAAWDYHSKMMPHEEHKVLSLELLPKIRQHCIEKNVIDFVIEEIIPLGGLASFDAVFLSEPPFFPVTVDIIEQIYKTGGSWLGIKEKKVIEERISPIISSEDRVRLFTQGFFQSITINDLQTAGLWETEFHYKQWKSGKINEIPFQFLKQNWYEGNLMEEVPNLLKTSPDISAQVYKAMWGNVQNWASVQDHKNFLSLIHHLEYITQNEKQFVIEKINQIHTSAQPFVKNWLWLQGHDSFFDFANIAQRLVYFSPDQQIKAIKRIFYYKHTQQFDLTVEKLEEIIRVDDDIFKINQEYHPDVFLDVSIAIVISLLRSLKQSKTFLGESDLMTITLDNLTGDRKRKFAIVDFFEKCRGRTSCTFSTKGRITKETTAQGEQRFLISFPYDQELVAAVKNNFPIRSYDSEKKVWTVPATYESLVIEFANKFGFVAEFTDVVDENLVKTFVESKPNYIEFCEGRPANILHSKYHRKFWWCLNQPCFQNCETIHGPEDWEQYTLLDFLLILGFQLDDHNGIDYVEKGKYYQFIGTINRFNRLLERAYCNECGEILSPSRDAHFAHYRVTRFYCSNEKCSEHRKEIYLHHCLNGRCANIIDSRVSKKCKNGWTICDNKQCGCCCSHEQYERRLSNLETVGGAFINETREAVKNKIGHLERAMHFCYKCGKLMQETERETFKCRDCDVIYELRKNFFNRPHRNLEQQQQN